MGIEVKNQMFHLFTKNTSYLMEIVKEGYLAHIYWGKKIEIDDVSNAIQYRDRGYSPNPAFQKREFSLDTLPQEYPQYGNGDFRDCAYQIEDETGCRISDLRIKDYKIYDGKYKLEGLPYVYENETGEVISLEITMYDAVLNLDVILIYNVFEEKNAITRSVKFINRSKKTLRLLRTLSMSIDIRRDDLQLVSFYGSHNNERNYSRCNVSFDKTIVESTRGASSPFHAPFIALLDTYTNENYGDVYAFQFVYSGNFRFSVQKDVLHTTRINGGINPFDFSWRLFKGEQFQTPEMVMIYTDKGLQEMSHIFHALYRDNLCRGEYKYHSRPVLINNWEATYFNFHEELLLQLAEKAAKTGVELFVLDDGWFKGRNSDTTSLGDWICDVEKIPNGLKELSRKIHKMGMQFGIWMEPEMVSVDSDLYRKHPDYCIHVPNRNHTFGRDQLVLDLGKKEVREYLYNSICNVLDSAKIEYVKWDMNRNICDCFSDGLTADCQKELMHRYMLGLYELLDRITSTYPSILFEGCASGGGRFDPGMLYYMPQTWTSDNTDAICRSAIQYTTSFTFPLITMGSHVSVCPNEQVGRITPFDTRFHVALFGNLGYELNLLKLNQKELEQIKQQISYYKSVRSCIQFGKLYRLKSPFEGNTMGMNVVSRDGKEVLAVYVQILSYPNASFDIMKLKGLEESARYENMETKEVYFGSQLMYAGLTIPYKAQDFSSRIYHFKKLE